MSFTRHSFADPESWHALRSQDVTASVAAALLGLHPYTSAFELHAEKAGRVEPEDANKLFRRGHVMEPAVAAAIRWDYPSWTVQYPLNLYFRDPASRVGSTPDSFCVRPDRPGVGAVQFKSVGRHAFRDSWLDPDTQDVVPPLWIGVQVTIEAILSGAQWGAIAALVVDEIAELHVIEVDIHQGVFDRVAQESVAFWKLIESGEQPPINWETDGKVVEAIFRQSEPYEIDLTGDAEFAELVERRLAASRRKSEAEAEIEACNPRIIHKMGNAEKARAKGGHLVSARTVHRDFVEIPPSTFRPVRIKESANV